MKFALTFLGWEIELIRILNISLFISFYFILFSYLFTAVVWVLIFILLMLKEGLDMELLSKFGGFLLLLLLPEEIFKPFK